MPQSDESAERERVLWLLRLLRADLEGLRFGELVDMRDDALSFPDPVPAPDMRDVLRRIEEGDQYWAHVTFDPPLLKAGGRDEVEAAAQGLLAPLQKEVLRGISLLDEGQPWPVFSDQWPAPQWVVEARGQGSPYRRFSGTFQAVFLATATDLLVRWWPELRRCKYEKCRALFLPAHGRQRYHDPSCSAAKRQKRYQPKRDYAAEYERRKRKELGANVRTSKRRKKGGKS